MNSMDTEKTLYRAFDAVDMMEGAGARGIAHLERDRGPRARASTVRNGGSLFNFALYSRDGAGAQGPRRGVGRNIALRIRERRRVTGAGARGGSVAAHAGALGAALAQMVAGLPSGGKVCSR